MRLSTLIHSIRLVPAVCKGRLSLGRRCKYHVPLICNGKGAVTLGDKVSVGYTLAPKYGNGAVMLQARASDARITVGSRTAFSNQVSIIACKSIDIGSDCLIGDGVMIVDSDFHRIDPTRRRENPENDAPVLIGNNVWLGARVIVLKGVTIGDHSVIAAGSIVTRSIPPQCVAAGNPAQVIRSLIDTQA